MRSVYFVYLFAACLGVGSCSDITPAVFGHDLDGMPAAFGDFDSNELTDVFVIRNDSKTVEIMLAEVEEPLLRPGSGLSCSFTDKITSVVPGDFDGDAFMDVLVTTFNIKEKLVYAHVLWGGNGNLNCSERTNPMIKMIGQPLAIDYNQDMIIDLFGSDKNGSRTFWVFNQNRTTPTAIRMEVENGEPIRKPHSNAFLDLNKDFMPDLFITTDDNFEIWLGDKEKGSGFTRQSTTKWPNGHVGQSLYLDVELTGKMDLVLPVCYDDQCVDSAIMIYSDGWHNLKVDFKDTDGNVWGFVSPNTYLYMDTITLRGGDFNMDGYPDLLATLTTKSGMYRTFLLENVACSTNCKEFKRTFVVRYNALSPFYNETVMGVFYDFYQDGILDVILVEFDKTTYTYRTVAFKNSLDYDANFVKVMVLTGLTNSLYPPSPGTLGRKKRTYGTNLPGPSMAYKTTTQDGSPRSAAAAQLPQSAHFSLNLPYSTFGLGRTPNFVDTLTIGVSGMSREWTQIIPNSQMVVIPSPIGEPTGWKAQLFVTPSKLILLSVVALTGTCGLITAIIVGLYWKERREDKIEKLQEAHRFHFDAM